MHSSLIEEYSESAETAPTVNLRPYQRAAVDACLNALSSGLRRIGVSSPTGSGKTTMFMKLIPDVPFYKAGVVSEDRGKTLIVVNSVELAEQAEAAAKRILGDGWTVEVEQGQRKASGSADITVATYQTLNNADRISKFDPSQFKLVIVDEAHHAAAVSYLRLLHYFNADVELPTTIEPRAPANHPHKVPIIGFSATFSRTDQLALNMAFEEIVFHRDISTMLKEGWLAPAKSTSVKAHLSLEGVELNKSGDFHMESLAAHMDTEDVNEIVVRSYLLRAADRRSTLVFCVDLRHVDNLTQAFRQAGVDARSISSNSRPAERRDLIMAFKAGGFPVLVNCEVLTEGADIPQIDCVILARPTKSRNLLAQMVGRGLRQSPETGKKDCYIMDIIDNVSRNNGMVVSPTLFGLSHEELEEKRELEEDLEDEPRDSAGTNPTQSQEEPQEAESPDYRITYVDQDDPFSLRGGNKVVLEKASRNSWVACGPHKYVLELLGNGALVISSKTGKEYEIVFRPAAVRSIEPGGKPTFRPTIDVGLAPDLERALATADKYIERNFSAGMRDQMSRYAPWRNRLARPKAVKFILKLIGGDESEMYKDAEGNEKVVRIGRTLVPLRKLTAGQASSFLCAMKHGGRTAKAALDKKEAQEQAKLAAKAVKERLHRERNLALPASN
ncbi:hypothetical protein IAT38_000793 [Cryptococcus sp. DSM 104549]